MATPLTPLDPAGSWVSGVHPSHPAAPLQKRGGVVVVASERGERPPRSQRGSTCLTNPTDRPTRRPNKEGSHA
jgi:hypothetical protein